MLWKFIDNFLSRFSETSKNSIRYSKLNLIWIIYLNLRLKLSKNEFFGQNLEDAVLAKFLPEISGTYVDVGAGWPIRGSNTFYFYKLGWSGITVDPIKQNILLQRIFRPRDTQLNALLGVTPGTVDFFRFEPYEYSTSNYQVAQEVIAEKEVKLLNIDQLEIKRLDSLNLQCEPLQPAFLSIDVEGKDFEVLSSNDWINFTPRVICIETWSNRTDDELRINQLLENVGYLLIEKVSLSSVYVHKSYLDRDLH